MRSGPEAGEQGLPNCKVDGVTHSSYGFNLKSGMEQVQKSVHGLGPKPIKGVRGLSSGSKFCELIEKGALRSKHDVYVYKDGTSRMTLRTRR